jgi:hypothetical protein
MGAYLGKSTILIGFHRRSGERFVVCDLFGEDPPTAENRRTAAYYTATLTHEAFEANYAAFHSEPPEVLQAPTTVVGDYVDPATCRFVHIDACHLYDVVREDIETARSVLHHDGIVVFDDIRAAHTPGVPAAVWPEVHSGELRPICITPNKFYATWGDPEGPQDALLNWMSSIEGSGYEVQHVAGQRLIRVSAWPSAPPPPVPAARGQRPPRRWIPSRAKELAVDFLPPILTRWLRQLLRRFR